MTEGRIHDYAYSQGMDCAVSAQRLGRPSGLCWAQIHWPDRYVSLFGAPPYNPKNERPGDVPFKTQLEGLKRLMDAGKVILSFSLPAPGDVRRFIGGQNLCAARPHHDLR